MTTLSTGVKIGPYQVENLFPEHHGGFAQVALAHRLDAGEKGESVIIKVAKVDGQGDDDTYNRSLSNEVETLRQLKHPGIVRLYPIKVDERHYSYMARATALSGQPWFFVMEYLGGGSIETLIKKNGALGPKLAIEITQQMCMALDYIHTNGYSHLDIKTTNIMLRRPIDKNEPPLPVLIDFGAAQKNMRRAEVEAGALVYLPPERVLVMTGDKAPETVTDKKAVDMYAVGVTLYRMVTGELPFKGRRSRLTTAILNETPTRPMHYTPDMRQYRELDELIMQLLDKRPDQRPTAREVVTKLDHISPPPRFTSLSSTGVTLSKANSSRGDKRWKQIALGLLMLAIIEGGALAVFASNEQLPVQPSPPALIAATPTSTSVPTLLPSSTPLPTTPPATKQPSKDGELGPFVVSTPTPK